MKFPFFASFILFGIWLTFVLIRTRRKDEKSRESFWEKEERANSTRRQPLDDLPYVQIPYETLPFDLIPETGDETADMRPIADEIADCHRILNGFRDKKAVNLTGITNTDLKLTYGAPNITLLTEYDQNYTLLVRTMQKWAELLIQSGHVEEAVPIMEFCVETRTDISATYRTLADIYRKQGRGEKIAHLREIAEELQSAMRPAILRHLDSLEENL